MLEMVLLSLLGLVVLWFAKTYVHHYRVLRECYQQEQQFMNHLDQRIHVVRQMEHDQMFYWYDQDSGEFLAQGADDDEITAVIRARFPDDIFVVGGEYLLMGPDFELVEFQQASELHAE